MQNSNNRNMQNSNNRNSADSTEFAPANMVPLNIFSPTNHARVVSRVFIGSASAPKDDDFLIKNNISLIVCASNNPADIRRDYKTIFVEDFPDNDYVDAGNLQISKVAFMFKMHNKAKKVARLMGEFYDTNMGNILVHCQAGVNRSALIIGMFMMQHLGYSYQDTMRYLALANHGRSPMMPVLTNQTFRAMLYVE